MKKATGLLTAAALSAALGLLVLTAMSTAAHSADRYMTSGDFEVMAGRNDRVNRQRVILTNAALISIKTRETVAVKLNAGSVTRGDISVIIRDINKGKPFKITKYSSTGFTVVWYESGYQKKVSILLNGKGY